MIYRTQGKYANNYTTDTAVNEKFEQHNMYYSWTLFPWPQIMPL